MKELTDEQYRRIGREVGTAWSKAGYVEDCGALEMGRAAYAASFPYAVVEALEEPQAAERATAGTDYLAFSGGFPKDYREILQFTLKNFITNRFTRLTKMPDPADPAVKAVKAVVEKAYPQGQYNISDGKIITLTQGGAE